MEPSFVDDHTHILSKFMFNRDILYKQNSDGIVVNKHDRNLWLFCKSFDNHSDMEVYDIEDDKYDHKEGSTDIYLYIKHLSHNQFKLNFSHIDT